MNKINLNNKDYEIIDAKETITIPDCFVKDPNKIGRGHGEAKFYVGQTTDNTTLNFFDNFTSIPIILSPYHQTKSISLFPSLFQNPSSPFMLL